MDKTKGIKKNKICIVGLGYVGLPLAIEFGKKYITFGYDKNIERIKELSNGYDRTLEVSSQDFKSAVNLNFTKSIKDLKICNIYIITVPTPVDKNNVPDMSILISASKTVGKVLSLGDIVIYESTVYPGATEEVCVPVLEKFSGLEYNKNFFCGYSPERINPGDREHKLTKIIKVTSGSNEATTNLVDLLYKSIIPVGTYKVSSIAIAEASKVIENTQRDVNIALINELSIIFDKLKLDSLEILNAAGSKWNFLPFKPGLVGGHCIGVDPYYLTYKAVEVGYTPEIILAGRKLNDGMGKYIAERTILELSRREVKLSDAKIAIFGFSFKENCPDFRNTKVIDIINHLETFNCKVAISDNYVDKKEVFNSYNYEIQDYENFSGFDAAIISVAHDVYKKIELKSWVKILTKNGVFIDVKSIYEKDFFSDSNINYWRL